MHAWYIRIERPSVHWSIQVHARDVEEAVRAASAWMKGRQLSVNNDGEQAEITSVTRRASRGQTYEIVS